MTDETAPERHGPAAAEAAEPSEPSELGTKA